MSEQEWSDKAKRYVKAELKRQGVTYEDLAARLTEIGMLETKASVSSKLSRGSFPATFFLASLKVIGTQNVRVDEF